MAALAHFVLYIEHCDGIGWCIDGLETSNAGECHITAYPHVESALTCQNA